MGCPNVLTLQHDIGRAGQMPIAAPFRRAVSIVLLLGGFCKASARWFSKENISNIYCRKVIVFFFKCLTHVFSIKLQECPASISFIFDSIDRGLKGESNTAQTTQQLTWAERLEKRKMCWCRRKKTFWVPWPMAQLVMILSRFLVVQSWPNWNSKLVRSHRARHDYRFRIAKSAALGCPPFC